METNIEISEQASAYDRGYEQGKNDSVSLLALQIKEVLECDKCSNKDKLDGIKVIINDKSCWEETVSEE